jgi:phosphoribosylaminoimidazolecarboxamide formyltransferase / IMP cyclohydrolase
MRAILSVSDKTGLVELGRELVALGYELVSTGGTLKALDKAGLPVTSVSDVTGFPEMLDGRVKTLHPNIHAGILARRNRPDDLTAIEARGIKPIAIVVVNLYPFAKTAADASKTFDELVEEIDIGGPSLVRAAAKNFRDVLVVVDPEDYPKVVDQLKQEGGPTDEFRLQLMRKAFKLTSTYDTRIAEELINNTAAKNGEVVRVYTDRISRELRK